MMSHTKHYPSTSCPTCYISIDVRMYARHVAAPHSAVCHVCRIHCVPHTNSRSADIRRHLADVHGIVVTGRDYGKPRARPDVPMAEWDQIRQDVYAIINGARHDMDHLPWER